MHYTPTGKEVVDRPLIGFTVADKPHREAVDRLRDLRRRVEFRDPAARAELQEPARRRGVHRRRLARADDAPHARARKGHDLSPDLSGRPRRGRPERAEYDFNWQIVYNPMKPIFAPKGRGSTSRRTTTTPRRTSSIRIPNRTVYRGRMTWEEMMSPFFSIITDAKTDPKTILKLRGQTRIDNGA